MTLNSVPEITAENVATLFPEVDTSLAREILPTSQTQTARDAGELEGYDEEQVRLMDEVCIVLDNNDRPIGSASKKLCTLNPTPDSKWRGSGGHKPLRMN
jgi:isopentenyl-diphosphate delta-isomerase